jgi:riboflavin kinase/FMN adenylyltransferase
LAGWFVHDEGILPGCGEVSTPFLAGGFWGSGRSVAGAAPIAKVVTAAYLIGVRVIYGLNSSEFNLPRSSLTVGNFDGVHGGHRQIIAQARRLAESTGGEAVVLTFEPHPLSVVAPAKTPPCLAPLPEKLDLLAAAGAQVTVVAEANRNLLTLTAEQFIERVLLRLNPTHIVEGSSFGFGRGRSGTPETLRRLGGRHGFEVLIVDPVRVDLDRETTVEVSSSIIRRLISEGRMEPASRCLGRPYGLSGKVVVGRRRGKQLGFPTANLAVEGRLIPADGVYAGSARLQSRALQSAVTEVGDSVWPAAISIGTTPTFEAGGKTHARPERRVEAHLLGADAEFYGRQIRLEFGAWLRNQEKFESPDDLVAQIARDVEAVRRYAADAAPIGGLRKAEA